MSTYGSFEATEEIFPGRAGSILLAKSTHSSESEKFAIKTFNPPVGVLGAKAAEQSLKRFLVRAQLQQNLGELSGSMWAPILETGSAGNEGYYVTRHYPRSIQALIGGGVRLPAKGLHAVITGVVLGLEQIRNLASRSHGNLKPGNILIDGRGLIQSSNIALADPASDNIATAGGDAADLAAIGQLIHQIITGRDAYTGADWSPQGAPEWAHLGPRAVQWRDFCRRLVEGNEDSPTIETIESELRKLRPPSKGLRLMPKIAAVLAVAASATFFTVRQTREYHRDFKEYQDDVAEMQPAWPLFFPDKVSTTQPVTDFYLKGEEADLDQGIVVPLISQNTAKLNAALKLARNGTFSVLLAKAENDLRALRPHDLSIIADGYQKFEQRLRTPSHQTPGNSRDSLFYAVNIAVTEHGQIDSAILAAANSVDPGILDSMQTRWINQLNDVAAGIPGAIVRTKSCTKTLEEMKFDAAKTPAEKAASRIAELRKAALTGADPSNESLNTLVSAWQTKLISWNTIDHPQLPQTASNTIVNGKPISAETKPPAVGDSATAEIENYKLGIEQAAKQYPKIQYQIWTTGWKAATGDNPDLVTLKKKYIQLRSLIEQIEPPAIDCPIDKLSAAVNDTYTKSVEDIYATHLNFSGPQFPTEEQVKDANDKVKGLSDRINASFAETANFSSRISNGADKTAIDDARSKLLATPFIQTDKTLYKLWGEHLDTLTANISNLPADRTERWKMFTEPRDPPVLRETRLALLRSHFTDLPDPSTFFTACTTLRGEFDPESKDFPHDIDDLAWQSWRDAFVSVCSRAEAEPQITHDILALKAVRPKDGPALPEADYNLTLADLKKLAATQADLDTLKKAMNPIIDARELGGIRSQLNPISTSFFKGPDFEKIPPLHVDSITQGDAKSFKISLADQDVGDSIQLKFERLHSTGSLNSTRLLSTEVSFKVCQMLARACEKTNPGSWHSLVYQGPQSPIPFWKCDLSSIDPCAMTQTVDLPTPPWDKYDPSLYPDPNNPDRATRVIRKPGSPMEFISPAAAELIAAIIHCRLPTQSEWQEADREDQESATKSRQAGYNLRGAEWYHELNLIHQYYQLRLPDFTGGELDVDFPHLDQNAFFADGSAPAWNDELVKAALAKPRPVDKNPLFFREVGKQPGAGRFSDLVGNVAEFVSISTASGPGIAVIGGSAISPPEIKPTTAYRLNFAGELKMNNAFYSDVGFRLAYDDPASAPLKDIQSAISKLKYRPVNFSAASTPPPTGRK